MNWKKSTRCGEGTGMKGVQLGFGMMFSRHPIQDWLGWLVVPKSTKSLWSGGAHY